MDEEEHDMYCRRQWANQLGVDHCDCYTRRVVEFVKVLPAYREEEGGLLIFHIPPPGSQIWHEGKIYLVLESREIVSMPKMPHDEFKIPVQFKGRVME